MFRPFLRVGAKSIERRTFVHSRGLALRSFTFKSSRHVFGRFVGRIGLVGLIGCSSALLLFGNSLREPVYLDAPPSSVDEDVVVDPSTSIPFPKTILDSGGNALTLLGVGVRKISFLRVKVYSVGFYADLKNSNLKFPQNASFEDQIDTLIHSGSCTIRIVPTRSTSYTHLRDGFLRALRSRLQQTRSSLTLSPDEEEKLIENPLHQLNTLFPTTLLPKHTPLEVFVEGDVLTFKGLGSVKSEWVAKEFVRAYFVGSGISPKMKKSVEEGIGRWLSESN